jgi:SAM-dependent methyltransferase
MKFQTDYQYTDRKTKAKYVWLKYQSILSGNHVLDIGADECNLKRYIDDTTTYWGIGIGGNPDQELDIEKDKLPFKNNSFDCVLCLDVLEHIENIHDTFDEICRVTRRYAIIALPNPYAEFWRMLRFGDYEPSIPLKYYGLPLERHNDRHKWFFSSEEAEKFIIYRAAKNGMRIIQMDYSGMGNEGIGLRRMLRSLARMILLRNDLNLKILYAGPIWAALEKQGDS